MLSNVTSHLIYVSLMPFCHGCIYRPDLCMKKSTASTALTLEAEDDKNSIFCLTGMLIISTKQASTSTAF